MTKTISFSLGPHFTGFVEAQVGAGRYSNASEVVRAGLCLLEEQELRRQTRRAALIEGVASGPSAPLVVKGFIASKRAVRPSTP